MRIFVGDDWAEDHHDVHLMNEDGKTLVARRLPEGVAGIRAFHDLVAGFVDEPGEVIVGIETDRGLWVTALVAADYQVYAIDPLAASRYRDRHNVTGAVSDSGDAKILADLVALTVTNHRQVDSWRLCGRSSDPDRRTGSSDVGVDPHAAHQHVAFGVCQRT